MIVTEATILLLQLYVNHLLQKKDGSFIFLES